MTFQAYNNTTRNPNRRDYQSSTDIVNEFWKPIPKLEQDQEYIEKTAKQKRNLAAASAFGSVLNNISDGITLGAGGRVIKRDSNVDERVKDYQSFLDRMHQEGEMYKIQNRNTEIQKALQNINQFNTDRGFGEEQFKTDASRFDNKERLEEQSKQFKNYSDYRDKSLKQYDDHFKMQDENVDQARKDSNYWKQKDLEKWREEFNKRYPKTKPFSYVDEKGNRQDMDMPVQDYVRYYTQATLEDDPDWQEFSKNLYAKVPVTDDPLSPDFGKYSTVLKPKVSEDDVIRTYMMWKSKNFPYRNVEDFPHNNPANWPSNQNKSSVFDF